MNFEYFAAPRVEPDKLQALLSAQGAAGWRLHTCEPFTIMGLQGIGSLYFTVVMDRVLPEAPAAAPEPAEERTKRTPIGGTAMR